MSLIGHFRRSRSGGWEGDIRTLTLDVRLRLKPNDDLTSPNAPAFRAMVGWSHVGDAWETRTRSRASRPMVRVDLDDPLFPAPISMVLLPDEDDETAVMVWQRPKPRRREADQDSPHESDEPNVSQLSEERSSPESIVARGAI